MDANMITSQDVSTLSELFKKRVEITPDKKAYRQYDVGSQTWSSSSWHEMANEVARWQAGFEKEGLQSGDRVAVMVSNSREWVVFDQAAMGLGLVTVPLYVEDRSENVAYIINHADVKLLFVQDKPQWKRLLSSQVDLGGLKRIISITRISADDEPDDQRLESLSDWLFGLQGELLTRDLDPDALASIVYTSGTTGRSKGVMLSHKNMLFNTFAAMQCNSWTDEEVFLSFLPLSHMFERIAGYYMAMAMGAEVAYARSIPQLGEDLVNIRPTVLVSVPRIYERVYAKIQDGLKAKSPIAKFLFNRAVNVGWCKFQYEQGRGPWHPKLLFWNLLEKLVAGKVLEKLGGRLRVAICGGAALSEDVAKLFIGLGLPLVQGYGLTESSPVIAVNRMEDNIPSSIGTALPGVQVRIGKNDELQSFSDSSMLGYWDNQQATKETFTEDGWLKTGDKARIDPDGHIYITGRLKDIIVMANGEKVPPADMEMAIALDPLFDQIIILGEAKPYLTAIVVLNPDAWADFAVSMSIHPEAPDALSKQGVDKALLQRVSARLKDFPGYAHIRKVTAILEPWTVDDGLLTPTLKIKRPKVMEKYSKEIEEMYKGH
ncbi:MAG: long-chain fatty acid--CoA ligase [Gammaproteobacteria bacterium]|nr:long-chain fatty acid--CoA ligase [Gammaproteobacteria bacterium]MCW8911595.1 long-chain fatty acid--CoA ligase [Gammaproteobacteria bacterium]MCW9004291.1 long-chain fatty acid--CoA ligase [Gammaproteobacteria bacterium]MCW9055543.1 long-chain fatty acid--CoA ligase [Gammaproteobacteria bacterium]